MLQRYGNINIPKINLSRPFKSKGLQRVIDQISSLKSCQLNQLEHQQKRISLQNCVYSKNTDTPKKLNFSRTKLSKNHYLKNQYNSSQKKIEEKQSKKQNTFQLNSKCYPENFQQNFTLLNKKHFNHKQEENKIKRKKIFQNIVPFKAQKKKLNINYKQKKIFQKPPLAKMRSIIQVIQLQNMEQSTISEFVNDNKQDDEKFQQKIIGFTYELENYRKKLKSLLQQRKNNVRQSQLLQSLNKIKKSASSIFQNMFQIQTVN